MDTPAQSGTKEIVYPPPAIREGKEGKETRKKKIPQKKNRDIKHFLGRE